VHLRVKQGLYKKFVKKDEHGSRLFYFYEKKDFEELIGDQFEIVYDHCSDLQDTPWLMLGLRKIS
jgi:hypothetical protein